MKRPCAFLVAVAFCCFGLLAASAPAAQPSPRVALHTAAAATDTSAHGSPPLNLGLQPAEGAARASPWRRAGAAARGALEPPGEHEPERCVPITRERHRHTFRWAYGGQ